MQSTSCKIPGSMKHKPKSRLPGETLITSDADDTTLMAESKWELKSLLVKMKEESEKAGLKLNSQKPKITIKKKFKNKHTHTKNQRSWHPVPSFHGKYMGKQWKQ